MLSVLSGMCALRAGPGKNRGQSREQQAGGRDRSVSLCPSCVSPFGEGADVYPAALQRSL